MRQRAGIGFPILAIEWIHRDIERHPIIETAPGDSNAVLIGARRVKALDPTRLAEPMLGAAGVESVGAEIVFALN